MTCATSNEASVAATGLARLISVECLPIPASSLLMSILFHTRLWYTCWYARVWTPPSWYAIHSAHKHTKAIQGLGMPNLFSIQVVCLWGPTKPPPRICSEIRLFIMRELWCGVRTVQYMRADASHKVSQSSTSSARPHGHTGQRAQLEAPCMHKADATQAWRTRSSLTESALKLQNAV